ncbi:MAG: hypothetical protein WCS28_02015 [Thiomicrospira sp.]|jgi:hypothetical protein
MNAQEFDAKFDAGEDIFDQLDLANAKRPMQKYKRVYVDFPAWMLESLDKEASRIRGSIPLLTLDRKKY